MRFIDSFNKGSFMYWNGI